ncbi:MAG TPA: winged helix-turn-helix domain-containing protein [Lentisphaeria bacterium]|jgi:putative transposase|nr:winged helix-turn-helix domain-containing protein [Lentisphaeria bacterium]
MGNPKGVKRDFAALEQRRMQAAKLFARGVSKAEVARRCRVSNQSAGRWHAAWAEGGCQALKHPGRAGRKARLQPLERVQLAADLQSGPEQTLGHATALWTLPRIVALIGQRFGHRYSTAQVSRLLRQMGWSCQKPARRALERDAQAIRRWKQRRWPAIKKKPAGKGEPSSSSTQAG